jgi:excisionase family DNA binding protein
MTAEAAQIAPALLTVEQAATFLGMSKSWCYHSLKKHVPHVKVGRILKFRESDLRLYIERQTRAPIAVIRDVKTAVNLRELMRGHRIPSKK